MTWFTFTIMWSIYLSVSNSIFFVCLGFDIPTNFYGSPEIFSGYLPNQDQYVEAFTLHKDCLTIKGTSHEISRKMASTNPQGTLNGTQPGPWPGNFCLGSKVILDLLSTKNLKKGRGDKVFRRRLSVLNVS